jgi:type IV pilus assembly protein PilB
MAALPAPAETGEWPDGWLLTPLSARSLLSREDMSALRARNLPSLWASCVAAGIASDAEILTAVASHFGLPIARMQEPEANAVSLVPEELARRFEVVPLRVRGNVLDIACADPRDIELERTLGFAAGRRIALSVARRADVLARIAEAYCRGNVEELTETMTAVRDGDGMLREMCRRAEESPVDFEPARLVDALIIQAIRRRASDVHLEPHETTMGVRYRVDGVLHEVVRAPLAAMPPIVSRLKVLANLDIADRLRPQDGRAQLRIDGRRVDLRISTLPVTALGEKVVVRLLDNGESNTTLTSLGFTRLEMERLERLFKSSEGLVLVTGPTGSGKTTTLYTALRTIQNVGINIVTVEDPIEYRLDGITQVQVHERAGLTFATALRSILRQDPDVVLVGEIRDRETAEVAVQASLTGHLVLSTLHTNDAPSSIVRLMDIGLDLTVVAPALRGVIAQRLLRRVCPECRIPRRIEELAMTQRALVAPSGVKHIYEAAGCPACDNLGYRGRIVVPEIAIVGPALERAIGQRASPEDIAKLCRNSGMLTFWQAGLERVIAGETTLNELLDNIYAPVVEAQSAGTDPDEMSQADIDSFFTSAAAARETIAIDAGAPASPLPAPDAATRPAATQAGGDARSVQPSRAVPLNAVTQPVHARPLVPRVLVVDEDAEARRALRAALEQDGFRVLEAADGQTALEYARRLRPDFVVLELALQRLDGLGLLRAMHEESIVGVRTVVLTVQNDPDIAEWALELGAAAFLTKPMEARLVASRLHAIRNVEAA